MINRITIPSHMINAIKQEKKNSKKKREFRDNKSKSDQNNQFSGSKKEKSDLDFDLELLLEELNQTSYFIKKGLSFTVDKNSLGKTILVKDAQNRLIQEFSPNEAKRFLNRVNDPQDPEDKGNLINVKC